MQVRRIVNLGDIVTPNIMRAIGTFTTLIASKKSSSNPAEVGRTIGGVLQANMKLINDFKLGTIIESAFNEEMLSALEKATGVKLNTDEFDSAWNTMNPVFAQFQALLNEAIAFNSQSGQKIIFISFTNPKDIRHLIGQLIINSISYKTDGMQLTEIAGIKLLTTYAAQKSKAELIVSAIKELRSNPAAQGTLAASMGTVLDQYRQPVSQDIKYVRGVNDIHDPVLKEDLDKTNNEVEKQATLLSIETLIWKKFEKQSLSDVLNSSSTTSKTLSPCML